MARKHVLALGAFLAVVLYSCTPEEKETSVRVQSIQLSEASLTLEEGETETLTVTFSPSDATDKSLSWGSSASNVASVSDGRVSAISPGKAVISAISVSGGVSAFCQVTVEPKGPAISFAAGQDMNPVIDEKGGTITFSFKAKENWTVSSSGDRADSWLKIEPESGSAGDATVKFNVAENTEFEGRSASVRFQSVDFSQTVVVTQKQKDDLTVTSPKFEVGSEGGKVEVVLKSNIDYSYTVDADWIKAVTTKAYEENTLVFEVAPNTEVDRREGSITFTGGHFSETVWIYQEGEEPTLVLTSSDYDVPAEGGEVRIELNSNVDIRAELPQGTGWLREVATKSVSTHTYVFAVDANEDADPREASIRFFNDERGLSETVTLRQAQKNFLVLEETEIVVSDEGGVFEIKVSANMDYDYVIEGDWITKGPETRGMADYAHSFEASALPADEFDRKAEIVFRSADGKLSTTVTVRQADQSPLISFEDPEAKRICVLNWDRTGDGEISRREAAAVRTFSSSAFRQNDQVLTFNEFEYFTGIEEIPGFCFQYCTNLESIKFPESLKSIGIYAFSHAGLKGDLALPEGLEVIEEDAFVECKALTGNLLLPSSIVKICGYAFYKNAFSKVTFLSQDPPVLEDRVFYKDAGCLIYVPKGKATEYQEAGGGWTSIASRITEEGHQPYEFFYSSSDYSKDGEVVLLQKATKGKGINIIFLGDGYVDKDMAPGGKYESVMRQWMEQFFVYEPYKTFRDWFNIYTVKVVSKNRIFGSTKSSRKLTKDIASDESGGSFGNSVSTMSSVCKEYSTLVPNPNNQQTKTAVFMNTTQSEGRSFCSYVSSGYCLAFIFDAIDYRPSSFNHEIGGHGFAWLGDEYEEYSGRHPNPEEKYKSSSVYYANLDWRSDPSSVKWARFLADPRYAGEGLGVFEGGGLYPKGVYRATYNSLMRNDYQKGAVFNAPSREMIYKNIMKFGKGDNWTYDYETFVAADEAGRKQAAEAYAEYPPKTGTAALRSRSPEWGVGEEEFLPGLPPIEIDDSVKEIRISPDGKVTLIR